MEGIREAGFMEMTAIQKESLPITLQGGDFIGQAQTGTGKTAAFLITLYARILARGGKISNDPLALILSPTRELAIQTYKEARLLGVHTGLRVDVFYGGGAYRKQEMTLERGVDIVAGTPGRLLDFIRRGVLRLGSMEFLVIDEADRLMDMGFQEEIQAILRRLPPPKKRQSMMFSATIDGNTRRISRSFMSNPTIVEIQPEHITAEGIEEKIFHVEREMKIPLLLALLQKESVPRGMIFANTKIVAGFVVEKLMRNGYKVGLLTGDLSQNLRLKTLDEFKGGKTNLLVCSDVASRGLHIDDVTHIFNFDAPQDPEDYVHRIGRTARIGKTGKAYTLACDEYVYNLPAIESLIKRTIPFFIPADEDYAEDLAANYTWERYRRYVRSQQRSSPRSGGRSRPRPGGRRPPSRPGGRRR
jgi:ATP-dependent RNA helicase RhlB